MNDVSVTFERITDIGARSPTLVEGLPGYGLVAAIAVDQITDQFGLEHHGSIVSDEFPPVLSYHEGRARDMVRVYASPEQNVMTLQSDLALPPSAFEPLSRCVHEDLADEFERAIFIAGAPAESEEALGTVQAVATTDELEASVRDAGIDLVEGTGLVGGVTGTLANDCYRNDVPAVVLIVHADPYLPDPGAARSVIEGALEPLVDFDIDTTELKEQAEQIQRQMQQIAEQYQRMIEGAQTEQQPETPTGMYQ
jgi:uncharacterized protein